MEDVNKYLKDFYKGTKNPSLNAMMFIMYKYNNFEKEMKFIHIAGTNGKGSCTEMISNVLVNQGYKVGKFVSPHLIRFNERICINGKEISDEELSELIEELKPIIDEYEKTRCEKVTLFELETIMMLLYFYRNNVDFAVIETGLGGIYDCTNIITNPLVSIITSIGFDHMNLLGNTLKKIAEQKAGIIKEKSNTVIFETSTEIDNVFIKKCKEKNNELHILNESMINNYKYDEQYQYFNYKGKNITINLRGKIQIKNACLCIETIDILNKMNYRIDDKNLKKGLKTVIHKGRMECLNEFPTIIYDGAHNEPAIRNLLDMVKMYYRGKKKTYIISILKTKEYKKMLKILSEDKASLFVLTSGDNSERFVTSSEMYKEMTKYVPKDKIITKSLEKAIDDIMNSSRDSLNFIVGSFYVYGLSNECIKKYK